MKNKAAAHFTSRLVVGCIFAILIGNWIDEKASTTPLFIFLLLLYVIIGSFYLLFKETGDGHGR